MILDVVDVVLTDDTVCCTDTQHKSSQVLIDIDHIETAKTPTEVSAGPATQEEAGSELDSLCGTTIKCFVCHATTPCALDEKAWKCTHKA